MKTCANCYRRGTHYVPFVGVRLCESCWDDWEWLVNKHFGDWLAVTQSEVMSLWNDFVKNKSMFVFR